MRKKETPQCKEEREGQDSVESPLRLRKAIKEAADREQTTMSDIICLDLIREALVAGACSDHQVNHLDIVEAIALSVVGNVVMSDNSTI